MIPIDHIERLIQYAKAGDAPATKLSAQIVDGWLATARNDPQTVLQDVMSHLGRLPSCPQDFLGDDLYSRVESALGREPEDEQDEDDDSEDEE